MVSRDPITNEAREQTRATILALLDELGPEIESQAWQTLTARLVSSGLMPHAGPDAARRWLGESLGLTAHFSITVDAAISDLTPSPRSAPSAESEASPPRTSATPSAPTSQTLFDPANADAPRTDNPLAMAIVNFKGLRGSPEHRLQSPPLRSIERHWRDASKKKPALDSETRETDEPSAAKRHDPAQSNKKPRRWPWG